MITKGEIDFFESIKDKCNIIFDVGCREDIHYITASENKTFHFFEPNTISFNISLEKTRNISNNIIYINNFGLGNKTGIYKYWRRSESFFKRSCFRGDSEEVINLSIKRFTEYIEENNIKKIDFLKMDVEGGEPDILLDNPFFLKRNVSYIQFELGTTWKDRGDNKTFENVFSVFRNCFNFYALYNWDNLFFKNREYSLLTRINNKAIIAEINSIVERDNGFEIIMINRGNNANKIF